MCGLRAIDRWYSTEQRPGNLSSGPAGVVAVLEDRSGYSEARLARRRMPVYEKLGIYLLVLFGCAVLWGLYAIAEEWGWRWGLAAGGAVLSLLMWWTYRGVKFEQSVREAVDRAAREFSEREPKPVSGTEALAKYLERSSSEEAKARWEENSRRERLLSLWAEAEPQVMAAIERVNKALGEHRSGMHLRVPGPKFVGRDDGAFGITCQLVGSGRQSLGYDGKFPVVVSDKTLFVAGFHSWGEGMQLPIATLTFDVLANAIADGARWALEG